MTLRQRALDLLLLTDADRKARQTQALEHDLAVGAAAVIAEPAGVPGRPARPVLVPHTQLRRGSLATREGHAALLHAVAHIEFNAINLALDAIWRFAGMPDDYYRDWAQVAREEAYHFQLMRDHLAATWRSATAGTAGCASARGWTRSRTTRCSPSATRRRACSRRSTSRPGCRPVSAPRNWPGCGVDYPGFPR